MSELSFQKIWDTQPNTLKKLGEDSFQYRYHKTIFDVLFKDRAIQKAKAIEDNYFLDRAYGKGLDDIGYEEGVSRDPGQDDDLYRERIRFRRVIKEKGLTEEAVTLYVKFMTGADVEVFDEYRAVSNRYSDNPLMIFRREGIYSRSYIRFWNTPPFRADLLYSTVRKEIQPYVKVTLLPHKNEEAIRRVVEYYCDSFTLRKARYASLTIHRKGIVKQENGEIISYPSTHEKNPIGIRLHSDCSIPIEDLKADLENRIPSWTFYLKFGSLSAMLNNYIDGGWTDITDEMKRKSFTIWPRGFKFLYIDVIGTIRIDTPLLEKLVKQTFGIKTYIRDPLKKKLREIMPVKYRLDWGSNLPPKYWILPEGVRNNVYLFYWGEMDEEAVKAELQPLIPTKTLLFRRK